jgi:hypothetical protein
VSAYLQKRRVATRTVSAAKGRYSATLKLADPGTYRVVTTAAADSASGPGTSPEATIQVNSAR